MHSGNIDGVSWIQSGVVRLNNSKTMQKTYRQKEKNKWKSLHELIHDSRPFFLDRPEILKMRQKIWIQHPPSEKGRPLQNLQKEKIRKITKIKITTKIGKPHEQIKEILNLATAEEISAKEISAGTQIINLTSFQ